MPRMKGNPCRGLARGLRQAQPERRSWHESLPHVVAERRLRRLNPSDAHDDRKCELRPNGNRFGGDKRLSRWDAPDVIHFSRSHRASRVTRLVRWRAIACAPPSSVRPELVEGPARALACGGSLAEVCAWLSTTSGRTGWVECDPFRTAGVRKPGSVDSATRGSWRYQEFPGRTLFIAATSRENTHHQRHRDLPPDNFVHPPDIRRPSPATPVGARRSAEPNRSK
ncbi:hypothetical protein BURC_01380 [Burkholderiaceae bacterium]|nr:hypothetical protein BURC_01380 [Burkholderiaceae bacterium]